MSSFVGEHVQLKKAGRNHKGCCPFHNEKTPSFMVNDEKQIYHCFGCTEGGDIFSFVMKFEGLTFVETVKMLADRAGVTIPDAELNQSKDDAELLKKKKWCLRLNQIALEWFTNRLETGSIADKARNYLKSRGINSEFSAQLNLGAAENEWETLCTHLKQSGAPLELAAELGLLKKRPKGDGYYDFFRGRLMFPIISPRGEVIAFSGRVLDSEDDAKYLNSPDSVIFHKSMSVYGLNWALEHIRREDQALIVEGQMDLLGLKTVGINNVVAPLGTALTSGHVRLISRTTRNIVLVFDGDEAGMRAALRSLPIFIELGIMPRAATLPKDEDPDSFVRAHGADEFKHIVAHAQPLFDLFIDRTASETGSDNVGKVAAMQRIAPLLKQMSDPVEQSVYCRRLADRLGIEEAAVVKAVGNKNVNLPRLAARSTSTDRRVIVPTAERTLVELMMQMPELMPRVLKEVAVDDMSDEFAVAMTKLIGEHYERTGNTNVSELLSELGDPEVEQELRTMAFTSNKFTPEEAEQVLADCIKAIRERPQKESQRELNELIRQAEEKGDEKQLYDLLRRKHEMITADDKRC